MHLAELFEAFNGKRVLVVGDVMTDAYIKGHVTRMSPEAPVPVVDLQVQEQRIGGAGNVALNLIALGAKAILASVIGQDNPGRESAEDEKNSGCNPTRLGAGQKKDGSEGQPGNIDDCPEGKKQSERDIAPTVAFSPPEGHRRCHEEPHGNRPGQFMGSATAKPTIKGAQAKCQGDDGGSGGQSRVQGHAGQG